MNNKNNNDDLNINTKLLPEITPEEIKSVVEKSDFITKGCKEHVFLVKHIPNKGTLIVYAIKDDTEELKNHYSIQCADWLLNCNKDDIN